MSLGDVQQPLADVAFLLGPTFFYGTINKALETGRQS